MSIHELIKYRGFIGGGGDWDSLKNKPFGEETEVLFDQRVTIEGGDCMLSEVLPISAGDTVKVTWNGVEYECVAVDASAMVPGAVFIGNLSNFTGEDTGEPFEIVIVPGMGTSIGADSEDASIAVSASIRIEKPVVKTLDPKYLPGGGGGVVEIPITWNDEQDDFTVGNTFAEMRAAIDSGSVVVLKCNFGDTYYLQSDEGGYLVFMSFYTAMNSKMMAKTFVFDIDGYERFYCEQIAATEVGDIIHSSGEK